MDEHAHYLYINDKGEPEAISTVTGEIVPMSVQAKDLGRYRKVTENGKSRWIPLINLPAPKAYSPLLGDEVATKILSGMGIEKALESIGLTYREYCLWRKLYPEFADMVDEARKDRAELFYEKLEKVAEETGADEDEIALGRLKSDIYKHITEVSDPGRFGKKTQITAKIGVGRIEVETGIRRQGDQGFVAAGTLEEIERGQKIIEQHDLQLVTSIAPNNLPKKVDEL